MKTQSFDQPLVIAFLGLLGFCTLWSYVTTSPTYEEAPVSAYENAYQAIKADITPGDILLIHPPWRHDAVQKLNADAATQASATVVLPSRPISSGKIYVLKDTNGPPLTKRVREMGTLQPKKTVDGVEIRTVRATPAATNLNWISLLPSAKVQVIKESGRVIECAWKNNQRRFTCAGLPNWIYVGRHEMTSGSERQSCIWGHPVKKGVLRISFPNPPTNSRLRFEHALSTNATRSDNKSPVKVAIFADQKKLKTLTRGNQVGFASSSFNLPSQPTQELALEITAQKDGARHYCFNLEVEMEGAAP